MITPEDYDNIFVLGPSHHEYFEGVGISNCEEIETPLGNLKVNLEIIKSLLKNEKFRKISKVTDEEEHSLEM